MTTTWQLIGDFEIQGTQFIERRWTITHNGSCQCFKDCDCYSRKGEVLGVATKYSHPYAYYPSGGKKFFVTLNACITSYNAKTL